MKIAEMLKSQDKRIVNGKFGCKKKRKNGKTLERKKEKWKSKFRFLDAGDNNKRQTLFCKCKIFFV